MSRKHGMPSTIEVSDDLACQIIPFVSKRVSQFTSEEDRFFTEGDALSAGAPANDALDAFATSRPPRRWLTRKASVVGATVCAVVVVCAVLLMRSGGQAADMRVEREQAQAAPTAEAPASQDQPTPQARPAAEAIPPSMPPPAVPALPGSAALAASPAPSPASAPTVGPNQPSPAPTPADARTPPSLELAPAGVVAGLAPGEIDEACKTAYQRHRGKDVLVKCAEAFAADPRSADAAVMLAKTEFDRGRAAQALDWAKKAIAIDADRADAYVFLGGAEQAAGHKAAAKVAYQRYLKLAPQGRYASDLRAVLGSL
jgi:hypothetical protein